MHNWTTEAIKSFSFLIEHKFRFKFNAIILLLLIIFFHLGQCFSTVASEKFREKFRFSEIKQNFFRTSLNWSWRFSSEFFFNNNKQCGMDDSVLSICKLARFWKSIVFLLTIRGTLSFWSAIWKRQLSASVIFVEIIFAKKVYSNHFRTGVYSK